MFCVTFAISSCSKKNGPSCSRLSLKHFINPSVRMQKIQRGRKNVWIFQDQKYHQLRLEIFWESWIPFPPNPEFFQATFEHTRWETAQSLTTQALYAHLLTLRRPGGNYIDCILPGFPKNHNICSIITHWIILVEFKYKYSAQLWLSLRVDFGFILHVFCGHSLLLLLSWSKLIKVCRSAALLGRAPN